MTTKQLIYLVGGIILVLIGGFIIVITLSTRPVGVKVMEDLNSSIVTDVTVNVEHTISPSVIEDHEIMSTEFQEFEFKDGQKMEFSADGYEPLSVKYNDINYLDSMGITLYKIIPVTVQRKITGTLINNMGTPGDITINCDRCNPNSGTFSSEYSLNVASEYSVPIKLTYQLGPGKKIELILTPTKDSHATVDIAFDDSSTKDNPWIRFLRKIKQWLNSL